MVVCETLLPNVVAPEAHQNDRSYVHELSRPNFGSLHNLRILHGGRLHGSPQKP